MKSLASDQAAEPRSNTAQLASPKRLSKPKAIYLTDATTFNTVYGEQQREQIHNLLDIEPMSFGKDVVGRNLELLQDVEIVMASWGVPVLDAALLKAAPRLRAFFYAAGSVKHFVTPAFWDRNVVLSSAFAVNALPVAEYALSTILLSLKRFWSFAHAVRGQVDPWADHNRDVPGVYQSTVGLVSCGMIARRIIELLKSFGVRCIVYDPYLTDAEASRLGVELCSLSELFSSSDVVSLHTPLLPETRGFVKARLMDSMKPGATLINTARGALIPNDDLFEVFSRRKDLTAVLDVLEEEPPARDLPLLQLPNVWVTPHIAGSLGPECRRVGQAMVDELRRYLAGEPLLWQITKEAAERMA